MNYNLSETQFEKVVRLFKEDETPKSLRDNLLKIVRVLQSDNWEKDNIVNFILGLRYKDEFTLEIAKKYKNDPEFMEAVYQVYQGT